MKLSWRCALQRIETGDWTKYGSLPGSIEVDFHLSDYGWRDYGRRDYGPREVPFSKYMADAEALALDSLKKAHERGLQYVIFTHGRSTSRRGRESARSRVRAVMRSKEATIYIQRSKSIQHDSVFVAAIRENPEAILPDLKCPTCGQNDVQPRSVAGHFRCHSCHRDFNWFDLAALTKASASNV
jgi:hypothetical protein